MTGQHRDPLDVLRIDDPPVAPDPQFAARLRTRLEAAAAVPTSLPTEGVVMSRSDAARAALHQDPAPEPPAPLIPYLAIHDARAAIAWYADALGAESVGDPIVMDDGRIGHAELRLAGATLYLADEHPELGLRAPAPRAVSVSLRLAVDDTDAALHRARAGGATVEREPYEAYGSRTATILDPFGHRWMLAGPVTGRPAPIRRGDIGYVSVWTRDVDRAAAFYGHVLGWAYDRPAATADGTGRQVVNTTLPTGIFAGDGPGTLFCCYAVDDLQTARERIVAAGGSVGATTEHEFGTTLDAADPFGQPFAVFSASRRTPRPPLNGSGPGDLSYVTHEVTDSAGFRAFYARVLGWSFTPGRVKDGWEVHDCHPMSGVAGGRPRAVTVPMWTVTDIEAAVDRVRDAGGTVVQLPSRQPYGVMAECVDDQGVRFYLGEF
ncbi:VOC family protein [Mycobacterium sp. MYCO198283]|uniref:VOC family protein n=1 Tax=Mycobacterium sp. MYCO198283 TaxID=2883505 RepID=UPI001E49C0F4|nr:VOC family protein [Mycobacterium sp. MYCO198283]MCG5431885.1 VOC family protein [Mycobacterium sp. MYCO198283]